MATSKKRKVPSVKRILKSSANLQNRYVGDLESLEAIVDNLKEQNLRVVLTQGVYDLIHEGHAKYLEMAKSLGDVLIVGVDSDEVTKIRKGKNRPIVPESERIEMLVHLRHVDLVVLREARQETGDLIRLVKPDVLVTSTSTKDFTAEMARSYDDYCGEIVTLPPQSVATTSARIRDITIEGAEKLASEIHLLTQEFINKIRQS